MRRKNKEWVDAATYFNLRIKEFGKMIEIGMNHKREGVSCSNCKTNGFCNEGKVDQSGDLHGMCIVEANNYVHATTVRGATEKLFDDTA